MADLLTIIEAADYLRLNRRTVAKLVRLGELRGGLVAGRWRFSKEDLDAYIKDRRWIGRVRD